MSVEQLFHLVFADGCERQRSLRHESNGRAGFARKTEDTFTKEFYTTVHLLSTKILIRHLITINARSVSAAAISSGVSGICFPPMDRQPIESVQAEPLVLPT